MPGQDTQDTEDIKKKKNIATLPFTEEQKTLPASAEAMLLPVSGDHGPGHLRESPHQLVVKMSSSQAISKTLLLPATG